MIVDAKEVRRAALLLRGRAEDARNAEQRANARSRSSDGFSAPPSSDAARHRGRAEAYENAAILVEEMLQESQRGAG